MITEVDKRSVYKAVSYMACSNPFHLWSESASLVLIEGNLGLKEVVWC